MSGASNSSKVKVFLSPWCDNGYQIVSLHIVEEIGGNLPHGELELWLPKKDKPLEDITNENHGILTIKDDKENGITYEIPIFIDSRGYLKNTLTLNFTCIEDEKFFTELVSMQYNSPEDAVKILFKNPRINVSDDLSINNTPVYQNRETNYNFLRKLALGYKKNCVYGFGWDGFFINELLEKEEPDSTILGGGLTYQTNTYNLTYNKRINNQPYNPWENKNESDTTDSSSDYNEYQSKYCKVCVKYNDYSIIGKDHYGLYENSRTNEDLMKSSLYSNFTITGFDIPKNYKLGDIVKYISSEQKQDYPFTEFLVAGNELFFSQSGASFLGPHGFKFEFTTKLYGLNIGDWAK